MTCRFHDVPGLRDKWASKRLIGRLKSRNENLAFMVARLRPVLPDAAGDRRIRGGVGTLLSVSDILTQNRMGLALDYAEFLIGKVAPVMHFSGA